MQKIPLKVINIMKEKGARVEKLEGENLYSITDIVFGDEAWDAYAQ